MKINKQKVTKILVLLSIIIIAIGIIFGMIASSEIKEVGNPKEKIYIDGTDFTRLSETFVSISSTILGFAIAIYFVMIVVAIWIIYGIILLLIKIVKKIKEKRR